MKKLALILGGLSLLSPVVQASDNACNLIVYSTKSFEDANRAKTKYLRKKFKYVTILKNERDWFMVSVARVDKKVSKGILSSLKYMKKIPKDSICSGIDYPEASVANAEKKITKELTQYQSTKEDIVRLYNTTDTMLQNLLQMPEKEAEAKYGKLIENLFASKKQLIQAYNNIDKTAEPANSELQKVSEVQAELQKNVVQQPQVHQTMPQVVQNQPQVTNIPKATEPQIEDDELALFYEEEVVIPKQTKPKVDPNVIKINKMISQYLDNKKAIINLYKAMNRSLDQILNTEKPSKQSVIKHTKLVKQIKEDKQKLINHFNEIIKIYKANINSFKTVKGGSKIASFLKTERRDVRIIVKKVAEINMQQLCKHQQINCQ